jgi:hypothetical protein
MHNLSVYEIPCADCGVICKRVIRNKKAKCFDCREKQSLLSREILHQKRFNNRVVKNCKECGASLEKSRKYDFDYCSYDCHRKAYLRPRDIMENYKDNIK